MGGGKSPQGQPLKAGGKKFWEFLGGGKFFSFPCPCGLSMYDILVDFTARVTHVFVADEGVTKNDFSRTKIFS